MAPLHLRFAARPRPVLRRRPPLRGWAARLLLPALALASLAARAQGPDTTTAARYFPLAVGNEWHFEGWSRSAEGKITATFAGRDRIVAFEPAPPGAYVVERFERRSAPGEPPTETTWTQRWRYDPATGRVEVGAGEGGPRTPCPLGADFGSEVLCTQAGSPLPYEVSGGYAEGVVVGTDTVTTSRKEYQAFVNGPGPGVMLRFATEYGAGVGETRVASTSHGWTPVSTSLRTLRYARVDGLEYGAPLFPVASEHAPEGAAAPTLRVGPNPARGGAATARFALPAAAPVRLVVLDVLGREVARLADGPRAVGAHEASLATGGLAPGLYLVRLEARGGALTRPFSVVR